LNTFIIETIGEYVQLLVSVEVHLVTKVDNYICGVIHALRPWSSPHVMNNSKRSVLELTTIDKHGVAEPLCNEGNPEVRNLTACSEPEAETLYHKAKARTMLIFCPRGLNVLELRVKNSKTISNLSGLVVKRETKDAVIITKD